LAVGSSSVVYIFHKGRDFISGYEVQMNM